MRSNFDAQLKELNLEMLKMAGEVENIINMTTNALVKSNKVLAREAVEYDEQINELERKIERSCLKLLLQQQPVATDLRKISSALKMITDMERIGDQAADISELTLRLEGEHDEESLKLVSHMCEETTRMVTMSINAYVSNDSQLAQDVIDSDDIVDDLFNKTKDSLIQLISENKEVGEQAIDMLMIAKYFERIGDHAVNIAEWVLFSITGYHKNEQIM
ncbi:MAG: phosphate signaling complex protein PhoU [Clostridiales bacterium]|nr:phosphate signaling complex protein PhoU [Clostridiales bacterium]